MDNQRRSGRVYIRHGRDFQLMGDIKKIIEYFKRHLTTAKQNGDRAEEGRGYASLGNACLLYTSPSPRDLSTSRMPSSA